VNILVLVIILVTIIAVAATLTTTSAATRNAFDSTAKSFDKGNFTIELQMISKGTGSDVMNAIFSGKERWEMVILQELPSVSKVAANVEACPGNPETLQTTVRSIDNLLVFVYIKSIDGRGGTLAISGPCRLDNQNFPRTGIMTLDGDDIASLMAQNNLANVVRHELGHVLGLGTLWESSHLISPSSQPGPVEYLGRKGNLGNEDIGGTGKAQIESTGGQGTARGHWSEAVYQTELMTGWFNSNVAPMSRLTIRALEDLGYVVSADRADNYAIPGSSVDGRRLTRATPADESDIDTGRASGDHRDLHDDAKNRTRRTYGSDIRIAQLYRIESMPKPGRNVTILAKHLLVWKTLLP